MDAETMLKTLSNLEWKRGVLADDESVRWTSPLLQCLAYLIRNQEVQGSNMLKEHQIEYKGWWGGVHMIDVGIRPRYRFYIDLITQVHAKQWIARPRAVNPLKTESPPYCQKECLYRQQWTGDKRQRNALRIEVGWSIERHRCGWNLLPGHIGGDPLDYEPCTAKPNSELWHDPGYWNGDPPREEA